VFAGADGPGVFYRTYEDSSVAYAAGVGRLHDCIYSGLDELVAANNCNLNSRDDVGTVHHSSIDPVFPVLAYGLYFGIGKPVDVGLKKSFFDIVEAGFPDNGFNFLHGLFVFVNKKRPALIGPVFVCCMQSDYVIQLSCRSKGIASGTWFWFWFWFWPNWTAIILADPLDIVCLRLHGKDTDKFLFAK